MQCITLLTDFGGKDSYVGVMKGVIQGINPEARVIDLCHEVSPQDIHSAAFLLKVSYKYFPRGTIHVIIVDPGVGSKRKIVCLQTPDYLFLAPDNGVLAPIRQEEKIEEIVEVSRQRYFLKEVSRTFQGRDIFAPVAAHLSLGVNPSELGPKVSHFRDLKIPPVHFSEKGLEGEIIYIDRFGNLITNITRADLRGLEKKFPGKEIRITIGGKKELRKVNNSYAESLPGELLAIIGSSHYLEISLNRGNARKALGLDKGDKVTIKMTNDKTQMTNESSMTNKTI